jgi:hypothetical protein
MAYFFADSKVVQLDADLYARWVADGNPKADYYVPIPDPPGAGYTFNGSEWVAPTPYVPQAVTAYQARVALLNEGLLDDVEQAVGALPDLKIKLAWHHALHFERNSPAIAAVAQYLNLTSEQVDNLFLEASKIQ